MGSRLYRLAPFLRFSSNRTDAAKKLGISRRALQYKIKRYGLVGLNKRLLLPKRRSPQKVNTLSQSPCSHALDG
ncbi:MAG: hypothetical protein JOZ08_22190 [Verrucomicrobia bacterium]|nr:hypothetical protein [Verrucomicrobiota bacterium]